MGANMRGKAKKKQGKFMRCIRTPIRILRKARDLYTKSLLDCAGKTTGMVVCPVPQLVPQFPRNLSVVGSSSEIKNEDLRELVRVVSRRYTGGHKAAMNVDDRKLEEGEGQKSAMEASGVGRSYSVGVGRIGRIDEDKSCEFEEEEDDDVVQGNNGDLLCPRSKSYAARRRNIVYY